MPTLVSVLASRMFPGTKNTIYCRFQDSSSSLLTCCSQISFLKIGNFVLYEQHDLPLHLEGIKAIVGRSSKSLSSSPPLSLSPQALTGYPQVKTYRLASEDFETGKNEKKVKKQDL